MLTISMITIGKVTINPTKIICLGRNYLEHAKESGSDAPKEPVLFVKTPNTLIGDGESIIYPKALYNKRTLNRVDHEVELAVILKEKCKKVSEEDAYDYIAGYTIFNDITARKLQLKAIRKAHPWYLSKSLDTFGPIGPRVVTPKEIGDPHTLKIELKVNGEVKQSSNTSLMLFKIPYLIAYITRFITLEKDDIIATGTPSGISPIKPGDQVEASIEKIGTLKNPVILEE